MILRNERDLSTPKGYHDLLSSQINDVLFQEKANRKKKEQLQQEQLLGQVHARYQNNANLLKIGYSYELKQVLGFNYKKRYTDNKFVVTLYKSKKN